jgi:hypothetical protein
MPDGTGSGEPPVVRGETSVSCGSHLCEDARSQGDKRTGEVDPRQRAEEAVEVRADVDGPVARRDAIDVERDDGLWVEVVRDRGGGKLKDGRLRDHRGECMRCGQGAGRRANARESRKARTDLILLEVLERERADEDAGWRRAVRDGRRVWQRDSAEGQARVVSVRPNDVPVPRQGEPPSPMGWVQTAAGARFAEAASGSAWESRPRGCLGGSRRSRADPEGRRGASAAREDG